MIARFLGDARVPTPVCPRPAERGEGKGEGAGPLAPRLPS
jgi:hypothetical protein